MPDPAAPPIVAAPKPTLTPGPAPAVEQPRGPADPALTAEPAPKRGPGRPPNQPAPAPPELNVAALGAAIAAANSQILLKSQGQAKTEALDVAPAAKGYYLVDGVYKNALGQEVHEIDEDHDRDQPAKVK